MEDWEQFFVEKSRRRRDVVERRNRAFKRSIIVSVVAVMAAMGVMMYLLP